MLHEIVFPQYDSFILLLVPAPNAVPFPKAPAFRRPIGRPNTDFLLVYNFVASKLARHGERTRVVRHEHSVASSKSKGL